MSEFSMKLLITIVTLAAIFVSQAAFARDSDIKRFTINELGNSGLTSVTVKVKNGKVLLRGRVSTPKEKVLATVVSWRSASVTEVVNEIRVSDTSSINDFAKDLAASAQLRGKLIADSSISSLSFSFDVVNGVVFLSGRAKNSSEMNKVIGHAQELRFANQVVNYILIGNETVASAPKAPPPSIETPTPRETKPPKPETTSPSRKVVPENNQIISASSGSGFAVSGIGHIVTNNHVIEGCQKVYVHRRGRKYETDIVSFDRQNDLALLKGNFQPDVVLPLTSAKPQLAQDIYVSGYPFGLNISSSVKVTKGIISSLTGIGNNLAEMQIDAALQSGNSGGPILDEYGNVVGVAVAKLDVKFALENFGAIPENTNFGVKANIVEALLDANGVNYQQGKAEKPSGAEFSNILSNGTYYISCWMTLAQIEAMKTKKVMFSDLQ